jgi:hypothetical protein
MAEQSPIESSSETPVHYLFLEPRWPNFSNSPDMVSEWPKAITKYFPDTERPPFTIIEGALGQVDDKLLECDCMVSPANSFGIMDGG